MSSIFNLLKVTSLAVVSTLLLPSLTFAHATVIPDEVESASYQTFIVNVPNEKPIPTTGIRLVIPEGIQNVTPTVKPGWQIAIEKNQNQAITEILWSGGNIGDGLRDEFSFTAKTPSDKTELIWKVYQTYSDGSIVSWDQEQAEDHGHGDKSSGPASITKIISETDKQLVTTPSEETEQTANRALYIAATAALVGLFAVAVATRKK